MRLLAFPSATIAWNFSATTVSRAYAASASPSNLKELGLGSAYDFAEAAPSHATSRGAVSFGSPAAAFVVVYRNA